MSLNFMDWGGNNLKQQFTSVEDVLSGRGLCNLHAAIANTEPCDSPASIVARAGDDAHCAAALRLFTQIAGNVLGDLVLAVAAWDGVFLFGSVAKGLAQAGDLSLLRQAFEGTGRMSSWKKQIPLSLITTGDAAMVGLAALPLGGCY